MNTIYWLAYKNNKPEGICDQMTLEWHLKVYGEIPNVDITVNYLYALIMQKTDGQTIFFERLSEVK